MNINDYSVCLWGSTSLIPMRMYISLPTHSTTISYHLACWVRSFHSPICKQKCSRKSRYLDLIEYRFAGQSLPQIPNLRNFNNVSTRTLAHGTCCEEWFGQSLPSVFSKWKCRPWLYADQHIWTAKCKYKIQPLSIILILWIINVTEFNSGLFQQDTASGFSKPDVLHTICDIEVYCLCY